MNEILEIITPEELGKRIKAVRQSMGITQEEMAQTVGTTTLSVSKIESGITVYSPALIKVLAYLSQETSIDYLLSKAFDPEEKEILFNKNFSLNSIVKEKMKMLEERVTRQMEETSKEISEQIRDSIELL